MPPHKSDADAVGGADTWFRELADGASQHTRDAELGGITGLLTVTSGHAAGRVNRGGTTAGLSPPVLGGICSLPGTGGLLLER